MTLSIQTYRFIALSLAFLVFSTSVSFGIDMHFCKGQFKSFSFFNKAPTCHQISNITQQVSCPFHQQKIAESENCEMPEKDCCKNKSLQIEADKDLKSQTLDMPTLRQVIENGFSSILYFHSSLQHQSSTDFNHYSPPLLFRDVPVLIQTFLL